MKRPRILSALILGLIPSLYTPFSFAHVGNRPGLVGLTLGVGRITFSSRRHIDNTNLPYAALSYNFTTQWGIEVMGGAFTTESHNPVDNGSHVQGGIGAVDAVYHLTGKAIEPFVTAGVGMTTLTPNGTDAHQEGNVNIGVGGQYFLTKTAALRLEGRDFYTWAGGKSDVFVGASVSFFRDWV